jgi:alpha-L-fucosidase
MKAIFKHIYRQTMLLSILLLLVSHHFCAYSQETYRGNNFVILKPKASEQEIVEIAANVTPSSRQLIWQRLETTAFLHFGLNTFYNQEWGHGTEDPNRFNPTQLNTDQWAKELSETGLKMLIMTCKHHDGFCLWPSKYTDHSVANSTWIRGKGDLVKLVSQSCKKFGLKFGIYLSPWDRHEPTYGNSEEYNKFFLNQLTELLTNYGVVDEVWFDGACGEGPNGKRQVYDWHAYYSLIRKLQPGAVIAIMGPDIRWVGTESGYGRETEWSVVPYEISNQESIAGNSQNEALNAGFTPPGDLVNTDLGSRSKIREAKSLIWYPSEVDVSIRPGWFWHGSENVKVKSPEKLTDIYFSSVGRNSLLLLNIPPDSLGLISKSDIVSLHEWHDALKSIFKENLAENAKLLNGNQNLSIETLTDKNDTTSFNLPIAKNYIFEFKLNKKCHFDILLLQENIKVGQRIEHFTLEAWIENQWRKVTEATTVGYKRLLRFQNVETDKVRLTIDQSRLAPALAEFGLYQQLPIATANPASAIFPDSLKVVLVSNERNGAVYFSTDGSMPNILSERYSDPLILTETTNLRFLAIKNDGAPGFEGNASYLKSKCKLSLLHSPDEKYSGGNPLSLLDGLTGSIDFADGKWCGFNGTNLEATIDLGFEQSLSEFGVNFNENTKSWIFRPKLVEFFISDDGKNFKNIFSQKLEKPMNDSEQIIPVSFNYTCKARFVKVRAINSGPIPEWHPAIGEPSWLFVDEIVIK